MVNRATPISSSNLDGKPDLLRVADAVRTLLASYSLEDRKKIIAELLDDPSRMVKSAPKAGSVLGAIVRLIPQDRTWTVEELKQSVSESKVEASSKEIYNAIGYLTRRGHVKRVGYGRYMVGGVEFVTSDDFGGENTRHEDEYRTSRD